MVHSVEEQKVFALTMKTDMTAKAPQYFVKIVIQNAEEELVQLLVNLLPLNNNVLIMILVNLTINSVKVSELLGSQNITFEGMWYLWLQSLPGEQPLFILQVFIYVSGNWFQ